MRGQQVPGCLSPLPEPSISPSLQFPSSCVHVSRGPRGAEPSWSQVCWWQLGALGCLNHDPVGGGNKILHPSGLGGRVRIWLWSCCIPRGQPMESCQELGVRGNPGGFPVTCQGVQEVMKGDRTRHLLTAQFSQWPLTSLLGAAVPLPKRSIATG